MALCDFLISADIAGYDCENPMVKGAKATGLIINRKDINFNGVTYDSSNPFKVTALPLLSGKISCRAVRHPLLGRNKRCKREHTKIPSPTLSSSLS